VRIVAPNERAARNIAHHFSGGMYATLYTQTHYNHAGGSSFFPHGEYKVLSSEDYWSFQDAESI
jgi:hypothetical protein